MLICGATCTAVANTRAPMPTPLMLSLRKVVSTPVFTSVHEVCVSVMRRTYSTEIHEMNIQRYIVTCTLQTELYMHVVRISSTVKPV